MSDRPRSIFALLREQTGASIEDLAPRLGFSVSTLYRWERGEGTPRRAALAVLEEMTRIAHPPQASEPSFRFIDLFAGIGGLRRGFEPLGGQCVFTSEWDRYAQATYKANYTCDHKVVGDITKVGLDEIPEHDVLLAGFPCQPFSIAGVSKKNALNRPHGFADETQGTLFFDVAHIIAHHRPKAFVLENVKNLVNHDKGNTFRIILKTLTEQLGYMVHKRVVDAKGFVPQHRERIFVVGFREDNGFTFDNFHVPDPQQGPKLKTVLHPEDGSEAEDRHYTVGPMRAVDDRYVLTDHLWQYLQDYAAKHKAAGNGFGFGLVGPEDITRTLSARYFKDGSEILVKHGKRNPRRLTPRECSRLMGFDKAGKSDFNIVVSDTQAYKQFGNAVVVPVVEAVASHVVPWISPAFETTMPLRRVA